LITRRNRRRFYDICPRLAVLPKVRRIDYLVTGARRSAWRDRSHIITDQRIEGWLRIRALDQLARADIIIAAAGKIPCISGTAQDCWPDKHHQIGFDARLSAGFEQLSDKRNIAQQRNLLDRAALIIIEQPAQRDNLSIGD